MPESRPTMIRLHTADAAELRELLNFLGDWLDGRDSELLANSLSRFVGNPAYNLTELQADLARFAFLLGDNNERIL